MNALGARDSKLCLRLRRRFFQRESGAESGGKGAVCCLKSGDPAQTYTRREMVEKTATRLARIFVRMACRGVNGVTDSANCVHSDVKCGVPAGCQKARGVSAWPAPRLCLASCVRLFEQHHLPRGHEVAGFQAVEVDAGNLLEPSRPLSQHAFSYTHSVQNPQFRQPL